MIEHSPRYTIIMQGHYPKKQKKKKILHFVEYEYEDSLIIDSQQVITIKVTRKHYDVLINSRYTVFFT